MRMLDPVLRNHPHWETFESSHDAIYGTLKPLPALFPEEERSKQPSAFSILRALLAEFKNPIAGRLALAGAFGYDLLLEFDPIKLKHLRSGVKGLHLLLCDDIYYMDRKKEQIERYQFDFTQGEHTTRGVKRTAERLKRPKKTAPGPIGSDQTSEQYMAKVETVREG